MYLTKYLIQQKTSVPFGSVSLKNYRNYFEPLSNSDEKPDFPAIDALFEKLLAVQEFSSPGKIVPFYPLRTEEIPFTYFNSLMVAPMQLALTAIDILCFQFSNMERGNRNIYILNVRTDGKKAVKLSDLRVVDIRRVNGGEKFNIRCFPYENRPTKECQVFSEARLYAPEAPMIGIVKNEDI